MEFSHITKEVFQRFIVCEYKAYAFLRVREVEGEKLGSLLTSRAERVEKTWMEMQHTDPSMVASIKGRRFVYRELEATVDYAEWVESDWAWSPFIFSGILTVTREQRLVLAYIGKVIAGDTETRVPRYGYIITRQKKSRVQLSSLYGAVDDSLAILNEVLLNNKIPTPRRCSHCNLCEYRSHCLSTWKEADSLDLMGPLGEKVADRLRSKRIETVHQLSLTYRPRRKKKLSKVDSVPYKPEIHAMALERNSVIIERDLDLKITDGMHGVFLDFEGLPDESLYYLYGILTIDDSGNWEEQFWADSKEDEEKILRKCLSRLRENSTCTIYHYGSYDSKAIRTLGHRYNVQCNDVLDRMVNVIGLFYGRVYFPVYTHGLKDVASLFGAKWTASEQSTNRPSGMNPILWRYLWEEGESLWKEVLLAYNMEDCRALATFLHSLVDIDRNSGNMQGVSFSTLGEQQATDRGQVIHKDLKNLLLSGHSHYEKSKVSFERSRKKADKKRRRKRRKPRADRIIRVRRRIKCPKCGWRKVLPHPEKPAQKTIYDLEFNKNGVRKRVVMYTGPTVYCYKCQMIFPPKRIKELGKRLYSRNLAAWFAYKRVENRLSYAMIAAQTRELFGIEVSKTSIQTQIDELGNYYEKGIQKGILSELFHSPFLGVDDTSIKSVDGRGYIWVITNGKYFAFTATHNREAKHVLDMLYGYEGTLLSDFFPGFDSAPFSQQKCWSHLMKDINNGIWRNPFDKSIEDLGSEVSMLMTPIIKDARRFGLSKYHFNKHRKRIVEFYERLDRIDNSASSETKKLISRIMRYKDSLFRFLEHDGIPWHNNASELGLRHIAIQRKISNTLFQLDSIHFYLALLGIFQTCRANDCSFLDFLLTEQRDVVAYIKNQKRKRARK